MKKIGNTLKWIFKFGISISLMALLIYKITAHQELGELGNKILTISWFWFIGAFIVQLIGMTGTIFRWKILLDGQEMKVPLKHLIGSFLIGRFIGSFLPSTLGLDGYRMYDIAKHSGQISRSVSVIVVEKIIGFFVLSALIIATIPWGVRFLPLEALLTIALIFSVPVTFSFILLLKPGWIKKWLEKIFPVNTKLGQKIAGATKAVTTYETHKKELLYAVLFGFVVHIATSVMYYFTAHAIGVNVSLRDILFVGPLMIFAVVVPISVAGLGVREAVVGGLFSQVGHSLGDAALFAFLGYLVGEIISLLGGLVLLVRKADYKVLITGKGLENNLQVQEDLPQIINNPVQPSLKSYLTAGFAAGVLSGIIISLGEATAVLAYMPAPRDYSVLLWSTIVYAVFCSFLGLGLAVVSYVLVKITQNNPAPAHFRYAFTVSSIVFILGVIIARFRIFRDIFKENLKSNSLKGVFVQLAIILIMLGIAILIRFIIRKAGNIKKIHFSNGIFGTGFIFAFFVVVFGFIKFCAHEPVTRADGERQNNADGPNIILVLVDTVRADHLSLYGYKVKTSPNLDRFAQESIVFNNAYANASWTRPSVSTVLTGRYPSSHRTIHKPDALPDSVDTIAELLHEKGYYTKGIVTNFNLAPYFNFQQGFDDYKYLEPSLLLWGNDTAAKFTIYNGWRLIKERFLTFYYNVEEFYQDADTASSEAISWLSSYNSKKPYFLFLSYMDPHDPYFAHPYNGKAISRVGSGKMPENMKQKAINLYDGEIQYWDNHFNRVIEALKKRADWDNTMVIIFSDHGEEFYDHGGWWHGTTLYNEQVAVPLIVRLPRGESAGQKLDNWVQLVDIAPTVLRFAGSNEIPSYMQGMDIFDRQYESVFSEEDHEGNILLSVRYKNENKSWSYIHANQGNPRGLSPEELYNLNSDPNEKNDLAKAEKNILGSSRDILRTQLEKASTGAVEGQTVGVDDSARERLRSLGYIH